MKGRSFTGKGRAIPRLLLAIALLFLGCLTASSATFNIANGDVAGLINAINTANSNGEDDTINLAANGVYTLTVVNNTIQGPNGLPVIAEDRRLTINGNGATIARSTANGTPEFRIINISIFRSAEVRLNRLIIRKGKANGGGGIRNTGGTLTIEGCIISENVSDGGGGGIYSPSAADGIGDPGSLTMNNSTVSDNTAEAGGGIYASNQCYLTNSTISGNTVTVAAGTGGGIEIAGSSLAAGNCTVTNNSVSDTAGHGGGIRSSVGDVTLTGCTIIGNRASQANDIDNTQGGTLALGNTIVGGIGGFGTVNSFGFNLSTTGGAAFTAPGDQVNVNPKLDPAGLQDNGGPTETIALVHGSPAIDQGHAFGFTTDQRGSARTIDNPGIANQASGDGTDIGAYEAPLDPRQGGVPSFVVNTLDDHDDGVCGGVDCSLRDAIVRANLVSGSNTITFAPSVTGTITLDGGAAGPLVVSDATKINGPGARILRVSANENGRVFQFTAGPSELTGLTIHGGKTQPPREGTSGLGGGILNQAQLAVKDCAFIANQALGSAGLFPGQAGGSGNGGAVGNEGILTLDRCVFRENIALGAAGVANSGSFTTGGAGGAARGGAVYNSPTSTIFIYNCTFANNLAQGGSGGSGHFGGAGGAARGAAIYNERDLSVYASTLSNNTSGGGNGGNGNSSPNNGVAGMGVGGIVAAGTGATRAQNCIIAANFGTNGGGPDVQGTFDSDGYNLVGVGDTSSGFNAMGDQVGTFAAPINPKLGPVQNNGGPTDTMALLTGSPALDQGKADVFTPTDQRGQTRPNDNPFIPNASGGDGSDIGAFEFGGIFVVTTAADADDGTCNASHCTLREAINAANAQAGDDVIAFLPNVTGTIQLASALPTLSTNINLRGPGSSVITVRRNAGGNYRILTASNGTATGPVIAISGLTIANGRAAAGAFPTSSGGGVQVDRANVTVQRCTFTGNASDPSGFTYGGGIFNYEGTLVVEHSTFSSNAAEYGAGIGNYDGTAGNSAVGTLRNCTFSGNNAVYGGAVYNQAANNGASADFSLTNCTLSGNAATTEGGAIYNTAANSASAYTSLTDCTVNGNSAPIGGGIYNLSNAATTAQVFLRNNILRTGASGGNVVNTSGTVTSSGNNLTNDNTGFASNTGDIRNTEPLLGPLAFNGGFTQTHALLSGSPAINVGTTFFAPTSDQRGFFYLGANDIGAYEFNGIELRITSITRLANGDIQLIGTGSPGGVHSILAAPALGTPASFGSIGTATANSSGIWQFTDTQAESFPRRFYKASFP